MLVYHSYGKFDCVLDIKFLPTRIYDKFKVVGLLQIGSKVFTLLLDAQIPIKFLRGARRAR
jgi:hypothetical protein